MSGQMSPCQPLRATHAWLTVRVSNPTPTAYQAGACTNSATGHLFERVFIEARTRGCPIGRRINAGTPDEIRTRISQAENLIAYPLADRCMFGSGLG